MFTTLIEKELKLVLSGKKFIWTFSISAILIILSMTIGLMEYKFAVRNYESAVNLNEQALRETTSYGNLFMQAHRKPDPMQIFSIGVHNDIGRNSNISSFSEIKLVNSAYTDDPIFAVFRFPDLSFIVQVVLSLFAILFTYDAISGEREQGTLKLTFASPVPRAQYVLAKLIGSWLGLMAPLAIPFLIGILILLLSGVPFTGEHWLRMSLFTGATVLFCSFFAVLGLTLSVFTRNSSTSFLLLLVIWVATILILPRVAVMAAGQIITVPSQAEIEGQRDGYSKQAWNEYESLMQKSWKARNVEMDGMNKAEAQAWREANLWQWMLDDEAAREETEKKIHAFAARQNEDLQNRKAMLQKLALTISRLSPASAYQLIAMDLSDTNVNLKSRYLALMQTYRKDFLTYREKKIDETGDKGGIRITMDSDAGLSVVTGRDKGVLDLSDMPDFSPKISRTDHLYQDVIVNMGIILILTFLAFTMAFVRFLKYDVR